MGSERVSGMTDGLGTFCLPKADLPQFFNWKSQVSSIDILGEDGIMLEEEDLRARSDNAYPVLFEVRRVFKIFDED